MKEFAKSKVKNQFLYLTDFIIFFEGGSTDEKKQQMVMYNYIIYIVSSMLYTT